MNVSVDGKGFTLGEHRFIYNLYFLEFGSEFHAPSAAGTFKQILVKWADSLKNISTESGRMFLPFAPDDQWTDCLMATLVGDKVAFNFVRVVEGGWGVFDYDLKGFITSGHEIKEQGPSLGEYGKDEILAALLNVEVSED